MLRFLAANIRIRKSTNLLFTQPRSHPLTHFRFLNQETRQDYNKPNLYNNNSSSLTISYQVNSCGLSPQSASSASSRKVSQKSTENREYVLNFFKSYRFTETQIEKIITKYPQFLSFNLEKTIKPKIDYFLDVGFLVTELAQFVSSDAVLLCASLEKRIKPNFELLNSIIGNTRQIAVALRRNSRLINNNLGYNFLPNIRILQSYGVPNSNIAKLITHHPRAMTQATKQFAVIVNSIKEYGINPLSTQFIYGVRVMSGLRPSLWETKMAVYKSLGWSEGEVISAFTKHPLCMALSEEKIRRVMDFFVKKVHWSPSVLSRMPVLLSFSLEKRVIPRYSILSLLASKGLVKAHPSVGYFVLSEKKFLDRYVTKYQGQIPELPEIYKADSESMGFEGGPSLILGS